MGLGAVLTVQHKDDEDQTMMVGRKARKQVQKGCCDSLYFYKCIHLLK